MEEHYVFLNEIFLYFPNSVKTDLDEPKNPFHSNTLSLPKA